MTRTSSSAKLAVIIAVAVLYGGCMKPLTRAAVDGDASRAAVLVEAVADINAQDGWSEPYVTFTPLMSAAYYGHEDVVRLLITKGADENGKSVGGGTAIAKRRLAGAYREPVYGAMPSFVHSWRMRSYNAKRF